MTKRSNNLENLIKQREDIELKIARLQISLTGINKSISRLTLESEIEGQDINNKTS